MNRIPQPNASIHWIDSASNVRSFEPKLAQHEVQYEACNRAEQQNG